MTGAPISATMFRSGTLRVIPIRYLCSDLVALHCAGVARTVNLEEIWESGAVLEAEEPLPTFAAAEIRSGGVRLCGRLTRVEKHAFGWRIEIQFSPLTPWSVEKYRPEHLLDVSELG